MPRITINEVNSTQSQALDITSANPVAIIGTATKGPINTPIPISSYSEFISVFGTSAPAESEYPYGYFAAKECLYAGNPIVYTRLGDTTSQTGKATDAIYTKANVATCEASTPGIWANNYKVGFTRVGTTGQTYDISVIDTSDVTVATARVTGLDPADELEDDADNVLITLAGITITQLVNATTVEETTTYHAADLSSLSGTEVTLAGGTDGAITNDNIATIIANVKNICTELADDSVYNYLLITAPGIGHLGDTNAKIWQVLSDLCNGTDVAGQKFDNYTDARLCIVDSDPTTSTYTDVLTTLGKTDTTSMLQTAIFYPWYTGSIVNTNGTFNLPPSIAYLRAFAVAQSDGYPCHPIAGPGFGPVTRISGIADRLGRRVCEKITDLGINPISYHRNLGYFFDGNVIYNPTGITRTYQQLSIRQTINYIKQRLNEICYSLSYGLNVPIIRTQFQGLAIQLLDNLKLHDFVYGYSIALSDVDSDLAEGRISATIKVFPTSALEEFVIDLTIVNTTEAL